MEIPFLPIWESDRLLAMGFDQYQRYRLTAELALAFKGAAAQPWRVLDVGGFHIDWDGQPWLPMRAFLPADEVLAVDMAEAELPGYQRASGTQLPFADASFDLVVSCDTLEHVPAAERAAFVGELLRVARRGLVLAAPHDTAGVSYAERALDEYMRSFGLVHPMLDEHLRFGLPAAGWLEAWLEQRGLAWRAFASGYLPRWLTMMMLRHQLMAVGGTGQLQQRMEQSYNARFYARDQRGPGYRRVVAVACAGDLPAGVQPIVERAAASEPLDPGQDLIGLAVLPQVRMLTQVLAMAGHQQLMQDQLAASMAQLAAAQAAQAAQLERALGEIAGLRAQNAELLARLG